MRLGADDFLLDHLGGGFELLYFTEAAAVPQPLQDVAALARKGASPWEGWLQHAATAVLSSAISWAMAAWLWLR